MQTRSRVWEARNGGWGAEQLASLLGSRTWIGLGVRTMRVGCEPAGNWATGMGLTILESFFSLKV